MPRDTHAELLDAAQERFATDGFAGTSIRDLAAAVGIKESSVYNHFPSKQAVLDEVVERAEARLAAAATHLGAPTEDPVAAADTYSSIDLERLEAMSNGFLDLWLHDRDLVAARRVLTLEQYRTPVAGERLRDLLVTGPLAFQEPLFAELIRQGAFREADPHAVALAFWGPILAILTAADAPGGEPQARQSLLRHLEHFRATHAVASQHQEKS